jgi:hypothetical protein
MTKLIYTFLHTLANLMLLACELLLQLSLLTLRVAVLFFIAKYALFYFSLVAAPSWLYYLSSSFTIVATSYVLTQANGMLAARVSSYKHWSLELPGLGIILSILTDAGDVLKSIYENSRTITEQHYTKRFDKISALAVKILSIVAIGVVLASSVYLLHLYCFAYLQTILPSITPIAKLFAAYFAVLAIGHFAYKAATDLIIPFKITALSITSLMVAALYYYNLIPAAHLIFVAGALPSLVCISCLIIMLIASRFVNVKQGEVPAAATAAKPAAPAPKAPIEKTVPAPTTVLLAPGDELDSQCHIHGNKAVLEEPLLAPTAAGAPGEVVGDALPLETIEVVASAAAPAPAPKPDSPTTVLLPPGDKGCQEHSIKGPPLFSLNLTKEDAYKGVVGGVLKPLLAHTAVGAPGKVVGDVLPFETIAEGDEDEGKADESYEEAENEDIYDATLEVGMPAARKAAAPAPKAPIEKTVPAPTTVLLAPGDELDSQCHIHENKAPQALAIDIRKKTPTVTPENSSSYYTEACKLLNIGGDFKLTATKQKTGKATIPSSAPISSSKSPKPDSPTTVLLLPGEESAIVAISNSSQNTLPGISAPNAQQTLKLAPGLTASALFKAFSQNSVAFLSIRLQPYALAIDIRKKTPTVTPENSSSDYPEACKLLNIGGDFKLTAQIIKTAFRKFLLKNHPDKNPDRPELFQELFKKVNTAKKYLLDYLEIERYKKILKKLTEIEHKEIEHYKEILKKLTEIEHYEEILKNSDPKILKQKYGPQAASLLDLPEGAPSPANVTLRKGKGALLSERNGKILDRRRTDLKNTTDKTLTEQERGSSIKFSS